MLFTNVILALAIGPLALSAPVSIDSCTRSSAFLLWLLLTRNTALKRDEADDLYLKVTKREQIAKRDEADDLYLKVTKRDEADDLYLKVTKRAEADDLYLKVTKRDTADDLYLKVTKNWVCWCPLKR